jgi:5-(carboxyamino)imidazole ribonucleotide mutase
MRSNIQKGALMKKIAILIGSDSDWTVVKRTIRILRQFEMPFEFHVMSAHRTPDLVREYVRRAEEEGVLVFISAAGMSAQLPGAIASYTTRPVIGIPVKSSSMEGLDALLAIAQMPTGVPVATVAIDGGQNAALLALEIIAIASPKLTQRLKQYKESLVTDVAERDAQIKEKLAVYMETPLQ